MRDLVLVGFVNRRTVLGARGLVTLIQPDAKGLCGE